MVRKSSSEASSVLGGKNSKLKVVGCCRKMSCMCMAIYRFRAEWESPAGEHPCSWSSEYREALMADNAERATHAILYYRCREVLPLAIPAESATIRLASCSGFTHLKVSSMRCFRPALQLLPVTFLAFLPATALGDDRDA